MPTPKPTPTPIPKPAPTTAAEGMLAEGYKVFGGTLYWKLEDGTLTIRGEGPMPKYVSLPWAETKYKIKALVIENGITYISPEAFDHSAIEELRLPESVTEIGDDAFRGCGKLKTISLPSSLTKIGSGAFAFCESLEEVQIPYGVTAIPDECFFCCEALRSVQLPGGLKTIGERAFHSCGQLSGIDLSNTSLKWIGAWAFSECTSLQRVELPSGLSFLGDGAFEKCSSLERFSALRCWKLTTIQNYTFNGCAALQVVSLPRSITEIKSAGFTNCSRLWEVYYAGGRSDWEAIQIGSGSKAVFDAVTLLHLNSTSD